MEKKVLMTDKQEWTAPQCKVYGDVEALTLNPGGPGGRGRPAALVQVVPAVQNAARNVVAAIAGVLLADLLFNQNTFSDLLKC